jgi:metallo-beta-lactamase family protein
MEANGKRILMDCGINYEKNEWGESASNLKFEFNPASIDVVVLSHAHIDHSGNIPNLIRQGFSGPIFCTGATAELVGELWQDSLNIQLLESKKNRGRKGKYSEVLYSEHHIREARERLQVKPYNEVFSIASDIECSFSQAGHIPGAASIKLSFVKGNVNVGFTGDVGNANSALVADPVPMSGLDYLICESTYGSRNHSHIESRTESLLRHIKEICVQKKGKLVIPAFSIGRTQAIIYTLHELYKQGHLPEWLKIYTDSPLAIKSTQVYRNHLEILNPAAQKFANDYGDLFRFPNLFVLSEPAQSDYVSQSDEACIIVSAAGMLEGGRIQKHIRNNIGQSMNRVLIAGYCSEGTLGAKLLQGLDYVRINKREREVKASVKKNRCIQRSCGSKWFDRLC